MTRQQYIAVQILTNLLIFLRLSNIVRSPSRESGETHRNHGVPPRKSAGVDIRMTCSPNSVRPTGRPPVHRNGLSALRARPPGCWRHRKRFESEVFPLCGLRKNSDLCRGAARYGLAFAFASASASVGVRCLFTAVSTSARCAGLRSEKGVSNRSRASSSFGWRCGDELRLMPK